MRIVFLVASLVATTSLGAQSSDSTVVGVEGKAEKVTSVATTTETSKTRPTYMERARARNKTATKVTTKVTTPSTPAKTTVTSKVTAPAATNVKTETEFSGIKDDSVLSEKVAASNADFSDATSGASSSSTQDTPEIVVTQQKVAVKPVVVTHIGKPFSRPTTQVGFVNAIRFCDRRILIVRCDDALAEYNRVLEQKFNRTFADRNELAEFFAGAEDVPCPAGEMADLSRVLGTRVRPRDNWRRSFLSGERCLAVDNLIVASLRCGNPVKSTHYVRVPKKEAPAPVVVEKPKVIFVPAPESLGSAPVSTIRHAGFPYKRVGGGIVLGSALYCGIRAAMGGSCADIFKNPSKATATATATAISKIVSIPIGSR